ncbi:MAG: CotH kinase family protein [Hydrogeniiclostridium sp.]
MSTSRYLGRLAAAAMAAAILLVTILSACPEAIGVSASPEGECSYGDLFDPFSVMEIDLSVDEEDWQEMLDNALAEEYISCDLTVNGTTYYHVGVRPKGNTSLTTVASSDSDRFSFKFEFDHYVDGQTCEGLDKFVVNNIQSDSTWMKEYLSYQILTAAGVPSPLYCYAHITVNSEEWGLYLAIEALEDSFAERYYGLDHGQLYKVEGTGMGGADGERELPEAGELPDGFPDAAFGEMPSFEDGEFPGFPGEFAGAADGTGGSSDNEIPAENEPENGETFGAPGLPGEEAENSGENDQSAFRGRGEMEGGRGGGMGGSGSDLVYTDDDEDSYAAIFDNSVFDSTSADHQRVIEALRALSEGENLEEYINVDEVLRYIAANTVLVNLDSYFGTMEHNYYLYEEDGQIAILPWDYNLSFAGFQSGSASGAVNFPIDTPVSGVSMEERPLISQLLAVPEYLERYHAYLQELVDEYFNSGVFLRTIDAVDALIRSYVQSDPTAFYTYDEYTEGVEALRAFGLLRAESIQGQLDGTIPSTEEGQQADPSALVDPGDLDLSVMGSQGGGGMGGFALNRDHAASSASSSSAQEEASQEGAAADSAQQAAAPAGGQPPSYSGEIGEEGMGPEAGGDIVPERNGGEQAAAGADQPPEVPDGEAAGAAGFPGGRGGMGGMNGGFGNRGQGGMADSFGGVSSFPPGKRNGSSNFQILPSRYDRKSSVPACILEARIGAKRAAKTKSAPPREARFKEWVS